MEINTENLTFAELKDMVGSTKEMSRLPRPEKLEKSDEEVLFKVHQDGADITVYVKGYILFTDNDRKTVFAVDRCKMQEKVAVDTGSKELTWIERDIEESKYADCPWYIPVGTVGMKRLEHNDESREDYNLDFHIGNESIEKDPALHVQSVEDEVMSIQKELEQSEALRKKEMIEAVRKSMASLTEKQCEIMQLIYVKGLSQKEVAELKNVVPSVINEQVNAIKKKFLKNCKKFLR